MTQSSTQGAIEGSRDAMLGVSLRSGSKGRRMLLAGLILIAAAAPPAAGAAHGGSSLIKRTADIGREQIAVREKYNETVNAHDIKGVGPVEIFMELYGI